MASIERKYFACFMSRFTISGDHKTVFVVFGSATTISCIFASMRLRQVTFMLFLCVLLLGL